MVSCLVSWQTADSGVIRLATTSRQVRHGRIDRSPEAQHVTEPGCPQCLMNLNTSTSFTCKIIWHSASSALLSYFKRSSLGAGWNSLCLIVDIRCMYKGAQQYSASVFIKRLAFVLGMAEACLEADMKSMFPRWLVRYRQNVSFGRRKGFIMLAKVIQARNQQ